MSVIDRGAITLLGFYHRCLSPYLPAACRFYPTCSCYAIESIEKYGFIRGVSLALWRILRCHPFNPGGYDPVR